MADIDIRDGQSLEEEVGGVLFSNVNNVGAGTGNYDTFLKIGGNPTQISGFNTDDTAPQEPSNPFIGLSQTQTLLLANITSVFRDGIEYYEIRYDLNEPNTDPILEQIAMEEFKIYVADNPDIITRGELESLSPLYDLDDVDTTGDGIADDNAILLSEVSTGSGTDDYAIFVPVSLFAGLDPTDTYLYIDVTLGRPDSDYEQSGGFEEFRVQSAGYISGIKFFDSDQDGIFDEADGEYVLPDIRIYIDENNNGAYDVGEKTSITDANGEYFLTGVATSSDNVIIREVLPTEDWIATNPDGVDAGGPFWTALINDFGVSAEIDIGNFLPMPGFTVAKNVVSVDPTGDDQLNAVGDIVNYEIVVTNTGNVALEDVTVTDPLLGGLLTNFTGDDGNGVLDVDEEWTFTGSYAVTQDDFDSNATAEPANTVEGLLENEACVVASYNDVELDEQCADADVPIIILPGVELVKASNVQFITGPGAITYTYTLNNTGNTALNITSLVDDNYTPLNLADDIPIYDGSGGATGDTDGDGLLDVGETWTFSAIVNVTQDQFENNDFLTNVACVTTDDPLVYDCDDETVEVRRYGIEIDKALERVINPDDSIDPDDVIDEAGDTAVYSITVGNTGNQALTNVEVADSLDPSLDYISGDTDGDDELDTDEEWIFEARYTANQDDIDGDGIDINGVIDGDGDIDNRATADADNVDEVYDDALVPIEAIPGINLEKTADVGFIQGPGQITYTYTVTNTGTVALNVTSLIDDNYTPGLTADDITLYNGAGEVSGDNDMDGLLDVNETWTFTAIVNVSEQQFLNNDLLTNEACVTTDIPDIEDCDDETVEIRRYDINIDKTLVDVIGSVANEIDEDGDVAVYEIKITNDGNQALTNVMVTDSLDPTVTFQGGDTDGDGELDTDEEWTYQATYTATQDDIDNNGINYLGIPDGDGDIDNRATVTADNVDPESDDAVAPIVQRVGLLLEKTSVTEFITGPQTVTYTFNVTNDGNFAQVIEQLVDLGLTDSTSDDVILYTDGDPTGPAMGDLDSDGLLDLDETWTFSYDFEITQDMFDNNLGGLINVACVEDGNGNLIYGEYNIDRYDIAIEKSVFSVDGSTTDLVVDEAGEQVVYDIEVSNTGDVALTTVMVTDSIADAGSVIFQGGDTDGDGELDTDEEWTYQATYTATQLDIDTNGGGDGFIENVATADSFETGPVNDDAMVAVDSNPRLRLTKTVLDVGGEGPHAVADEPGDVITYLLVATNTGNTTLNNVTIVDPLTGTSAGPVILAPGGTLSVETSYEVTQDDIDSQGTTADGGPADCDIDNTAVADSDETRPVEASAEVMLDYNPSIDLEKLVSVNGGAFVDADLPTGPEVTVNGSIITFRIELSNTGNVTLTDVTLSDVNLSDGVPVDIDLSPYTITGLVDADNDGQVDDLAVGGSAFLEYSLSANPDQHINTATVTVAETTKNGDEVTDSDSAHYFGLIGDGPGVRTPGGWGNSWKLLRYWDGIEGNEPHSEDGDNFPDAELSMDVEGLGQGIIIGGNFDDVLDEGEIFVDLETARDLLNGSTGGAKRDKLDDLARHAIASTLNALAGNNVYEDVPDDDVDAPIDWINEAAAWLLESSSDNGVLEVAGYEPGSNIIRANSDAWRNGYETTEGDISAGRDILSALDEYNNTGVIDGVRYAHDADSSAFTTALEIAADEFLF